MDVRTLEPAAARDERLVAELASLINGVYVVAEEGMWQEGHARADVAEMAELIEAGEIAVAEREGEIDGVVQIHEVAGDVSLFGMLAAAPDRRGSGVGRALVEFAEERSRERGLRAIRLELLVPRTWKHPHKEFLKDWYGRRGYRRIGTTRFADGYPHLAPLLATPCDLEIHEKPLAG